MNTLERLVKKHWDANKDSLMKYIPEIKDGTNRYVNIPVLIDDVIDEIVFDRTLGKYTHYNLTISDDGDKPVWKDALMADGTCLCDNTKTVKVMINEEITRAV